jgi:diguanylate cyclase (GGDEF)-like protein
MQSNRPAILYELANRSALFIGSYFICWQLSAQFSVATDVSAFYPATGVLAYFTYRWGWRYLPAAALAILVGSLPQYPFWEWEINNFLHLLRQLLVYSALALIARKHGLLKFPLETLHSTMRLLIFAAVSSLLSAALALAIFWTFHPELNDQLDSIFFGFWVGDFSGILMFFGIVSIAIALARHAKMVGTPERLINITPTFVSLLASSLAVVILMAILSVSGGLHSYSYLIMLPVMFGTVAFGLNFGIASAVLANVGAVVTYMLLGMDQMPAIQLQLLCAVILCIGLVLGGAIDDRKVARFNAWHDPLTGLLNRRAFFEQGEMMLERAKRYQQGLAVVMLDLDYFKLVNDTYGHDAGDRLLCEVAEQCKSITRRGDLCARMGGEEFALLIEHADADQAIRIAERLRTMIYRLKRGTSNDPASASFGVSLFRGERDTLSNMLSNADRVLYVAKETGRNRVMLDEQPPPLRP